MRRGEHGYLMVALLVAMSIMAIMMGIALPAWRTLAQREKEAELVFRGEQYARAIRLFQQRFANATPPDIDVLVRDKFLRMKYKDPITNGDFEVITPASNLAAAFAPQTPGSQNPGAAAQGGLRGRGAPPAGGRQAQPGRGPVGAIGPRGGNVGGVMGVVSKSSDKAFRLYNGRDTYNQWVFMPIQQSNRAGGPGGNPPGPVGNNPPAGRGRGVGQGQRGGGAGGGLGGRAGQPVPPPPAPPGRGGRGF